MIAFMILFFPAVIATRIYESIKKVNLSRRQWFGRFCTNALFINLFCFLIKSLVLNTAGAPLYTLHTDTTPIAAANYMAMAIPAAIVFSLLQVLLSKSVKVEVEDPK